ncbi:MAG: hypothetical protein MUF03_03020 [Rubrivivax sp.]|nr:hypothetical protein [Rubrivivax sp.]
MPLDHDTDIMRPTPERTRDMPDDDAPPASHADLGEGYMRQRWSEHFEEIVLEIGRLAKSCDVQLLTPGVIERVLHGDSSVCGNDNPRAFDKMRQLLMMHYSVRSNAASTLGHAETNQIIAEIVERIKARFGDTGDTPSR